MLIYRIEESKMQARFMAHYATVNTFLFFVIDFPMEKICSRSECICPKPLITKL